MDTKDIKRLLEDTRRQEEELRKDREALERVARILKVSGNGAGDALASGAELPLKARSFSDAVREAIRSQEAEFTIQEIFQYLQLHYPEMEPKRRYTTISSLLGSFKNKHLTLISGGPGVRSVFRKL